jgi:hypothetical protein
MKKGPSKKKYLAELRRGLHRYSASVRDIAENLGVNLKRASELRNAARKSLGLKER